MPPPPDPAWLPETVESAMSRSEWYQVRLLGFEQGDVQWYFAEAIPPPRRPEVFPERVELRSVSPSWAKIPPPECVASLVGNWLPVTVSGPNAATAPPLAALLVL